MASDVTAPELTLREATPEDESFLFRVYADSRREELAPVPWTDEQRHAFLASQFTAQCRYYRANYDGATYQIVLTNGQPIGRLFIARWPDEIRIMDIALLTEHRGAGIGTRVMRDVCDEADAIGTPIGIHVERQNPAHRLYRRLGFEEREDRGVYLYLVRPPRRVS